MSLIQINDIKCKKDGLCVKECPVSIIRQEDKKSRPEMVAGGEQLCLVCGHCVAVCPGGALDHQKIPLEVCPTIENNLKINQEQAIQFLRSRRSIRNFKNQKVEKEMLQNLIDNARYAPTASNSQQIDWTVLNDPEAVKKVADLTIEWMRLAVAAAPGDERAAYLAMVISAYEAGADTITRGAPCLIFASAPESNGNGMVDLTIALSYLELAAVETSLGTCWAGFVTHALDLYQPLKELIALPDSHTQFYAMMIGHSKVRYQRLPERKPAKINWK